MPKKIEPRKEKKIELLSLEPTDVLCGTFEEVIANFTKAKEKLEKDSLESWLRFEFDFTQYYEDVDLKIYGYRLENDAEYEKRLAKIAASAKGGKSAVAKKKAQKEAADLKTYERLKKKFEKK